MATSVSVIADSVRNHPLVTSIELVGSRARGDASKHSDWDFAIATNDFERLKNDLAQLLSMFEPLAAQWDRLSSAKCYMLVVGGPAKIDLIFSCVPNVREPPWQLSRDTLEGIDWHFWDWILWLVSKQERGDAELVRSELRKMWKHLLEPLCVQIVPRSLSDAAVAYRLARNRAEQKFNVLLPRRLDQEISPLLMQST